MKFLFGGNKTKQAKSAIDKLAKQRDINGLRKALLDPDWQLREYAAEAFEQVGIPDDPTTKAGYLVAKRKFEEVITIGDAARGPLLLALVHSDAKVQYDASDTLIKILNGDAVQPIVDSIPGMDHRYVFNIALLLGTIKEAIAADKFITALGSSDAHVRWVAAYAIGEMGDTRALPTLEQMAENDKGKTTDDGPVKVAARIALEKIQSRDRPLKQLIPALSNSDEYVRFGAADALGRRGEVASVDALIDRLSDSSQLVRNTVITALGKIGDPRAVAPLTAIARSRDTAFRWAAINSIEEIAGTPVDIFIDMLDDPTDQFVAVHRLGKSNDPRAISALERLLDDRPSVSASIKEYARKSIDEINQRIQAGK